MTALPLALLLAAGAPGAGTPGAAPSEGSGPTADAIQLMPSHGTPPATATPEDPFSPSVARTEAARSRGAPTPTSPETPPSTSSPEPTSLPADGARTDVPRDAQPGAQARAELEALRDQVAALQQEVETLRERTARAEEGLRAADEAAATTQAQGAAEAEAAARSPERRAAATGEALVRMDGALRALSVGDASGVDAALAADAEALESARLEAGRRGSEEEATRAAQGAAFIGAAREALARGDLYAARIALGQAAGATATARTLAGEGSAAPPGPQGSSARTAYPGP